MLAGFVPFSSKMPSSLDPLSYEMLPRLELFSSEMLAYLEPLSYETVFRLDYLDFLSDSVSILEALLDFVAGELDFPFVLPGELLDLPFVFPFLVPLANPTFPFPLIWILICLCECSPLRSASSFYFILRSLYLSDLGSRSATWSLIE